jgi:hypothetical protein
MVQISGLGQNHSIESPAEQGCEAERPLLEISRSFPYDRSMRCHFCQTSRAIEGKVRRDDLCPHCKSALRCCKNCRFYDERAHNQCRETQAEWVADKVKENFCEFFDVRAEGTAGGGTDPAEAVRERLRDLFKK